VPEVGAGNESMAGEPQYRPQNDSTRVARPLRGHSIYSHGFGPVRLVVHRLQVRPSAQRRVSRRPGRAASANVRFDHRRRSRFPPYRTLRGSRRCALAGPSACRGPIGEGAVENVSVVPHRGFSGVSGIVLWQQRASHLPSLSSTCSARVVMSKLSRLPTHQTAPQH
jgi:hypothetical protein